MDLLIDGNRPETCATLGLECGACVRKSAASVSKICHNLDAHSVQRTFLQLYPSTGCHPMAHNFEAAYREMTHVSKPILAAVVAA